MEHPLVRPSLGSGSMLRALSLALMTLLLWSGASQACEKHLNGHQSSSDTNAEAVNR